MSDALERATALLIGVLDEDEARSLASKLLLAFLGHTMLVQPAFLSACSAEEENWMSLSPEEQHKRIVRAQAYIRALKRLAGPVDDKGATE